MSDTSGSALSRAYELIEAGNPQQARTLLEPLLRHDPKNADAWWIFAHAVDDPEVARDALTHVLAIDPDYAGARELMSALEAQYPGRSATQTQQIRTIGARPLPPPTDLPSIDTLPDPDLVLAEPAPRAMAGAYGDTGTPEIETRRRFPWPLLLVALAAVAVIVLVLALNPPANTVTDIPATAAAALPTSDVSALVPTSEVDGGAQSATLTSDAIVPVFTAESAATEDAVAGVETSLPATDEATQSVDILSASPEVTIAVAEGTAEAAAADENTSELIGETLAPLLSLSPEGVSQIETALGNTLIVNVCTTPQMLRTDYATALNALAAQSELFPPETDAIGAQLVHCADGDRPLRRLVVSADNARAYDNGTLSDAAFQSLWRSL